VVVVVVFLFIDIVVVVVVVVVVVAVVVTVRLFSSLRGRLLLLGVGQLPLALFLRSGGQGLAGEPASGLRIAGACAGGHGRCGSVGDGLQMGW
jgi:Na+-transporting NADH:ubiquinone oxidoreductase subunit NqrF